MLEVSGLNQFYGGSHTLWDVDLSVPEGSCTCLIGRNGVGKTTLLRAILGLVAVKSGSIRLRGEEIVDRPTEERVRRGIGYVPQGREIFPQLTVEENLRAALAALPVRTREIPDLALNSFPVLNEMRRRRGGDLSGGQQQQLAIARALVTQPRLLILDEPTEGIQPNIVHAIGDMIIRLNQEAKLTVLVVEQKLPFARRVAQRFAIMDKGRTVARGEMPNLSDELIGQHLIV